MVFLPVLSQSQLDVLT
jgi:hypothetical protein